MKKYISLNIIMIFVFVSISMAVLAQPPNIFTYHHCLNEVSFKSKSSINPTDFVRIKVDPPVPAALGYFYSAPQYKNSNCNIEEESWPVCYVSGNSPRVQAEFQSDCVDPRWIMGIVRYNNDTEIQHYFPPNLINLDATGKYIYKANNGGSQVSKMPNDLNIDFIFQLEKVQYIEEYKIEWMFAEDSPSAPAVNDMSKWVSVSTSTNQFYVLHKSPKLTQAMHHSEPTEAYHTLIHLGCTNGNENHLEQDIVDNIYNLGFKLNGNIDKIKKVDGSGPIKYWPPGSTACQPVSLVLETLGASCGGLSAFFEDVLRVQGIASSEISVVTYGTGSDYDPYLTTTDSDKLDMDIMTFFQSEAPNVSVVTVAGSSLRKAQFLVDKWGTNSTHKFIMNDWHNLQNNVSSATLNIGSNIVVPNVELNGSIGQGNDDPRSEFENHAIVKYNNKYYDPSYGSDIAADKVTWENNALNCYGGQVIYKKISNGVEINYLMNWISKLDDTSLQTNVNP